VIIQRVFHTYKDDFPILSNDRLPFSYDAITCSKNMTSLILELYDLTNISRFVYITRHTNDKIPDENLNPFITKFCDFVDHLGNDQTYNIPTIWFVGHFESYDLIQEVRIKLDNKSIKYFEHGNEFESFENINESYWEIKKDAHLFPKFLHQVTMIGIDLLKETDNINELKQFECLEWLQYRNVEHMISDLKKMEQYVHSNSQFYQNHILKNAFEVSEFWENFKKIKRTNLGDGGVQLGSWPHFLFNICGASSKPKICD